jgi:hypothetical protein
MLHSGKWGTAVTSINGGFFGIVGMYLSTYLSKFLYCSKSVRIVAHTYFVAVSFVA